MRRTLNRAGAAAVLTTTLLGAIAIPALAQSVAINLSCAASTNDVEAVATFRLAQGDESQTHNVQIDCGPDSILGLKTFKRIVDVPFAAGWVTVDYTFISKDGNGGGFIESVVPVRGEGIIDADGKGTAAKLTIQNAK